MKKSGILRRVLTVLFAFLLGALLFLFVLSSCMNLVKMPEDASVPDREEASAEATPGIPPSTTPPPTFEPIPEPTPEPTPPPSSAVVTADMGREAILALGEIPSLQTIDATASRDYDALLELQSLLPGCRISWVYEYKGQLLPSDAEELTVTDLDGLEEALRCLPALKNVDLLSCQVTTEQMDVYQAIRPEAFFLFNVSFGYYWTVRSDITCFSTLQPGSVGTHRYTSEELYPLLRYCKKLRALDLGHNDLTDISLIGEMPELQALILGDNPLIEDISPLANCKDLMYIELFMGYAIHDFSPLGELERLKDLNLSYCTHLEDVSFLDTLPDIRNAWFIGTQVSVETLAPYKEAKPESYFICGPAPNGGTDSMAYGWRAAERNIAIRNAFTYWRDVVEYVSWDKVTYREGSHMDQWLKEQNQS